MSRKSTRINFSIHPGSKEDMDGIFAELKKRLLPMSGTICKLLKQFKADGFKFRDEDK